MSFLPTTYNMKIIFKNGFQNESQACTGTLKHIVTHNATQIHLAVFPSSLWYWIYYHCPIRALVAESCTDCINCFRHSVMIYLSVIKPLPQTYVHGHSILKVEHQGLMRMSKTHEDMVLIPPGGVKSRSYLWLNMPEMAHIPSTYRIIWVYTHFEHESTLDIDKLNVFYICVPSPCEQFMITLSLTRLTWVRFRSKTQISSKNRCPQSWRIAWWT